MANSEGIAGVHSYVLWKKETAFNTAVTPDTHFSATLQSFNPTINNNLIANYGMSGSADTDGRKIFNYSYGVLEISAKADMKVTNWTWMENVLGGVSGGGPYTYAIAAVPPSMTITSNIDNPGGSATDQEITYSGCVIEGLTIRAAVGQPVTASMDMKIAKAALDTALTTRAALPSEDVYNFTGGSIELPATSTLSNIIDSFELSIRNNWNMMSGCGSRLVQNAVPAELNLNVKITLKYLDNALYTAALGATTPTATGGPTEYATMVLNFVSGTRSMEITLSDVPMGEFAQIHELNQPIGEDLSFTASNITAVEDRT